ncbi:hypothetical protein OOT00_01525 [Desulfobotulus sp. H1]|uniref:Cytochrome c n=1 Tax=Desulfobotulus pelophilus TaxID=2823377 RepID=A0ABT3N5C3_9BACT|nr:hypothetical protein [Desulfobotulus pelophilus]MCW7752662.1 hypothetical protein [Desulfobotulus pelophilus]
MKTKLFPALLLIWLVIVFSAACSGIRLQKYPPEACSLLPGNQTMDVIENTCFLCHRGDFATRQDVCERKEMIQDAVLSKRMPKLKSLSEEDLQILLQWE